MSETVNISPLLDGFTLGAPISEHSGVVCCPAIKENTNKKFIVKIITVPANQSQLDALLLAGAYKDPADAMEYFRRKGEDILQEAELLKVLSKLEGFLPFEGWQMEPITRRRLGYQIYLVGSYKRSLEKSIKNNAFTHLEAINLGLDLCSALSVCRQSGYLYVALKPSNIYVSEKKEYRIGDLGFLKIDTLRYASLPERCCSRYTPPELLDPMAVMNLSVDTYAVGMILYQLYNDGHLPFKGKTPALPLPSPVHADYELAEIIMKAIHPEPDQRWLDPKDMGKAIASYMQRNVVNDIPITPFIPLDVIPEPILPETKKPKASARKQAVTTVSDNAAAPEEAPAAEEPKAEEAAAAPETPEPQTDNTDIPESENAAEQSEPVTEPEVMEAAPAVEEPAAAEDVSPIPETPAADPVPMAADLPVSSLAEETDLSEIHLSEDVARIISKADSLIEHQIPEETAFPKVQEEDPFAFVFEDSDRTDDSFYADTEYDEEEEDSDVAPKKKKKSKHFADTTKRKKIFRFFRVIFSLLLICGIAFGGFWYYQNVYLQTVESLVLTATQDSVTVLIDTDVEESRLQILCSDPSGKVITESVYGGKAVFTGLKPSTRYTVEVSMTGFHGLEGYVTDSITTEATTQVLSFEAVAGSEDGSVVLEFTVDGDEPDFWNIYYSAEGEDEKRETITNHTTMITDLTVGKLYTFTLNGGKDFDLGGETTLQYLASKLILADDLTVHSDTGSEVTVKWKTPGDVVIESWNVRCYDGYTYDNTFTVTETEALLTGLDPASGYTVDITAAGMTQPARLNITKDPITINEIQVVESNKKTLDVSWKHTAAEPVTDWLLFYSIDGSGNNTLECKDPKASITTLIPGATYRFTIQSTDNRTVFNSRTTYTTAEAEQYAENGVIPENLTVDLLKTPETENWLFEDLQDPAMTHSFAVGESASIVLQSSSALYMSGYETKVQYVFRNSYGNVLTDLISEEQYYWKDIWKSGDAQVGELDIPKLPSIPGDYVLELYFNGKSVAQLDITITE